MTTENRFGNLQAKLMEQTQGKEEVKARARSLTERFGSKEEAAAPELKHSLEKSEVYQVLIDPMLEPKEKADKIAELLAFNETDLESNPERMAESKLVLAQLLADFKDYNVSLMELIRDNPLSELGTDISEVFDKYHELVGSRTNLDEKLKLIDEALALHGGPEGLVTALLSAKDQEAEREQMELALNASRAEIESITADLRTLDSTVNELDSSISSAESDRLLFFKSAKKEEIRVDKERLREARIQRETKTSEADEKRQAFEAQTGKYQTFLNDGDFQLHQRILEILDVGSPEFKAQISQLAELTIGYINDTETTLGGSEAQIKLLLERSQKVLTMIQNTGEHVSILLTGQNTAQDRNTVKLGEYATKTEGLTGMELMSHKKMETALNRHITETSSGVKSAALLSQEMGKTETAQVSYVGRLQEGLSEAEEQKLISIGSASMTGVATLSRVESFAAAVPGLIAKGQYAQDAKYALGELNKEFERALSAKMAGNTSIANFTETLREVREAMSDRNDVEIQIATQRKGFIDNMIEETERLSKVNQAALSIEATVNKELFGTESSNDNDRKVGGAGAPAGSVRVMSL